MSQGLMQEVTEVAKRYAERCDRSKIPDTSFWNQKQGEVLLANGRQPVPIR